MEKQKKKEQSIVSKSSYIAEYKTMSHTTCEVMWLRNLLLNFNIACTYPMTVLCNNQATILIAKMPIFRERSKYIKVD